MTRNDPVNYYAGRAQQAFRLANKATSLIARDIHLEMSKRYARLSSRIDASRPALMVIDGGR